MSYGVMYMVKGACSKLYITSLISLPYWSYRAHLIEINTNVQWWWIHFRIHWIYNVASGIISTVCVSVFNTNHYNCSVQICLWLFYSLQTCICLDYYVYKTLFHVATVTNSTQHFRITSNVIWTKGKITCIRSKLNWCYY